MTNKLPEVGKRYKKIVDCAGTETICRVLSVGDTFMEIESDNNGNFRLPIDHFLQYLWEELPEGNQTIRENRTVGLSKEVEEDCPNEQAALDWNMEGDCEKEKKSIWKNIEVIYNIYNEFNKEDQLFITRYDVENATLIECEKRGIIGYDEHCLIRDKNNKIYIGKLTSDIDFYDLVEKQRKYRTIEFCTLTDFINQHNSLLDRVERLEKALTK